jgi:dCTP deaminase
MVLVDHQIRNEVKQGYLGIENFDEDCLQPASYDLRIGPLVYSPSSPTPDKAINISENGGWHRIQPYGTAVIMTYETLRLPSDMVGRFGLKSGFARRGLLASTGPQVDPGFEGKLFVSIMNLTPASHILSYKDTFLSIEFHKLEEKPEKTYEGPYQHKHDISSDILEDMVRFEGINLSQMQNQFGELSQHVKEWSGIASKFEDFLQEMRMLTTAFSEIAHKMGGISITEQKPSVVEARHVDVGQAKEEILALFRKRPRLYYSDIAEALQLDYETVIHACEELQREGLVEGEKSEKKKTKRTGKKN